MDVLMATPTNSYEYAFRIQYRLNKGTQLSKKFFETRERAEAFARMLLQDEYYNWKTVELYDNQSNQLIHTFR